MLDRKIALVVNPKAGKGKATAVAGILSGKLYHFAVQYNLFNDYWPEHFDGYSEVWLIGGDGTINYFINRYPDITIPIALFKGGTGDDFAFHLYGDADWKQQFEIVLKATPKPVDAGKCNDKLFLVGVGIGFEGEILKSMHTIRTIGGHLGYYLVVLKKIFSFKEHHFKVYGEELIADGKFLLVEINNTSRTGGGFTVSPDAKSDDGLLNLVLCKPLTILQRIKYLGVIEKGMHLNLSFIKHVTDKKFLIECDRDLPAHLDGEMISAQRFEFEVYRNKFYFLY